MNGTVIDASSSRSVWTDGTDRSGASAPSVGTRRPVGEVLEDVELRDDARRPPAASGHDRGRAAGQQAERLVERRAEVDRRAVAGP